MGSIHDRYNLLLSWYYKFLNILPGGPTSPLIPLTEGPEKPGSPLPPG